MTWLLLHHLRFYISPTQPFHLLNCLYFSWWGLFWFFFLAFALLIVLPILLGGSEWETRWVFSCYLRSTHHRDCRRKQLHWSSLLQKWYVWNSTVFTAMAFTSLQVFHGYHYPSLSAGWPLYKQCSGKRHIMFTKVSELYFVVSNFENSYLTNAVQHEF